LASGVIFGVPLTSVATSQDAAPPAITITAPVNGATLGGAHKVAERAKDRGVVARAEVGVDGDAGGTRALVV
jgi:hypothetical protein